MRDRERENLINEYSRKMAPKNYFFRQRLGTLRAMLYGDIFKVLYMISYRANLTLHLISVEVLQDMVL